MIRNACRLAALPPLLFTLKCTSLASAAPNDPNEHSPPKHHIHARIDAPLNNTEDVPQQPTFVFEYNYQQPQQQLADPKPSVKVDEDGLNVYSADQRFHLGISPFMQFAYRINHSDAPGGSPNGFLLQKFRPSLRGSYNDFLDYKFTLDIKSNGIAIHDAFVDLRVHPRVTLRLGMQKPIFGSEQRQSTRNNLFLSRSMASSIGASRDLGLALDTRPHDRLRIELGVYNGVNNEQSFRSITPGSVAFNAGARWAAIGKDGATEQAPGYLTFGAATHLRRIDGTTQAAQLHAQDSIGGRLLRDYAPDVYANGRKFDSTAFMYGGYDGFYLLAEFMTSNQQITFENAPTRIVEHAWHLALSYAFGGTNGWNGTTPHRSVFDGGLGALRISARVHVKNMRSRNGQYLVGLSQTPTDQLTPASLGASLAWQLSKRIRVQTDYDVTRIDDEIAFQKVPLEHVVRFGITAGY